MMLFRKELALNATSEADIRVRRQVFDLITRDIVSDRILTAYLTRAIPAADQLLHFKREFAAQLGLASFASFALSVSDRVPHKLVFSRASGRVRQLDMCMVYNSQHIAETMESVPFRLTRNMTTFVGPWLVEGVIAATLIGVAACLAKSQDILKNYLCIFLRDDAISFQSTQMLGLPDAEQVSFETKMRDRISANARMILKRIHQMMPTQQDSAVRQVRWV